VLAGTVVAAPAAVVEAPVCALLELDLVLLQAASAVAAANTVASATRRDILVTVKYVPPRSGSAGRRALDLLVTGTRGRARLCMWVGTSPTVGVRTAPGRLTRPASPFGVTLQRG